jgi:tetratricopeptide (TPR) repeat protein
MYKTFSLLLLLLLSHLTSSPQNFRIISRHSTDSLLNLLPGSGIEKRIDLLNELAFCFAPVNFDSSVIYATRAMRLATQHGFQKQIGLARFNLGNAYYFKMDFKNALIAYLSAQSILEKKPFNKEMGDVCFMLGNINFFIMRDDKAISYYRKALSYYSAGNHETSLPPVWEAMSLTMFFLKSESIDSALVYGYKMLDFSRKFHCRSLETTALMAIGMFYVDETQSVQRKQKTLVYCDSALNLATELKNDSLISVVNINLAGYYDRSSLLFEFTGDLALARTYYERAYLAAEKIGFSYLKAIILNYLAEIDIEEGKYVQAENNLDQSEVCLNNFFRFEWKKNNPVGIVHPFGKIIEYYHAQRERKSMYNSRVKLAMARGDFKKAFSYLQLFYESRDTMYATQQGRQFEILIAEDDADRQAQKIRMLAQDNELNKLNLSKTRFVFVVTAAGIVLVSIILLLFFQRRRLRAEQRSISMEQRLLRAQMNPHFIFNSLASIQNFVINENSDQASIYLSRFSQLVRNILDNSAEEYVPLEKEISTIENYLELQKVRYAGKIEYRISVDETIDTENILIPPMLAQPFIENAIEHGIRHKSSPGQIEIRIKIIDQIIRIEIEDDGVGREKAQEIESKQKIRHRSMAISITRDRLEILNKKLKKKIRMEILDLKDASGQACGTRVEFGIPVK